MLAIALPAALADLYGEAIEKAAAQPIRLLKPDGGEDAAAAEIALAGDYATPVRFGDLVPRLERLRWIHSTAAGIDDFVSPELARRGVYVTNSAGAYAPAMAELALAAMVMLARNLPGWLEAQRRRLGWDDLQLPGRELRGWRVGIVGYGATGRYLAAACRALGMEVWATRRTPGLATGEPVDRLLPASELRALLAASDVVVLTASLNETTRELLGAEELAAMKPGAILVNIARGGLVHEPALAAALAEGRLAGAFLDVTAHEPLPPESALWDTPNLVLTPHVAGETPESRDRALELFYRNLPLYLGGRPERMGNLVDLAAHL